MQVTCHFSVLCTPMLFALTVQQPIHCFVCLFSHLIDLNFKNHLHLWIPTIWYESMTPRTVWRVLTWGSPEPRGHWSRTWCPGRSLLLPHMQGARPCCCTCLPVHSKLAVTSGNGRTWAQQTKMLLVKNRSWSQGFHLFRSGHINLLSKLLFSPQLQTTTLNWPHSVSQVYAH